jgi:hypothetical protein
MDATNAFVLDGSVTLVWGFADENDGYATAILDKMPDLASLRAKSLAAGSGECSSAR